MIKFNLTNNKMGQNKGQNKVFKDNIEINKLYLLKIMIQMEEKDLNNFQMKRPKVLLTENDYNVNYKEFERLAKIYERMAFFYYNKYKYEMSIKLFSLALSLYGESGFLRKKCQAKYYDNDKDIYNYNKHTEAYLDCFNKKDRCYNKLNKIKNEIKIKY